MRAIVDGDGDRAAHLPAGRLDPGTVGPGGDQAGGRDGARRFEPTEDRGEPGQLPLVCDFGGDHPRRREGLQLTAAVAGHRVGVQAQPRQHLEEGPLGREHGGDRRVGRPERLGRRVGGREEMPARRNLLPRLEGDPIGRVEHRTELGEVRAEVGEHPRILRALAGEEERQTPHRTERFLPEVEPAGVAHLPAGGIAEPWLDRAEPLDQFFIRTRHDAQPGPSRQTGVIRIEGEGQVLQARDVPPLQTVAELSDAIGQRGPVGGSQQEGLAVPVQHCAGRHPVSRRGMLSQNRVAVDPGEAERVDPGAARRPGIALDPGAGRGDQLEAAALQEGVGPIRVPGRRQHPMMQRQGRLDQPRHAGGGHGVANLGRHGPQRPGAVPSRGKDRAKGPQLGAVGCRQPQAVALDEAHGRRLDPGNPVGQADRAGMPPGAGRSQPPAPAVAGQADPLKHRVDPTPRSLGVAKPLEDQHADSLPGDQAVGVGRERARLAGSRECAELLEDEREIDVGLKVDPPRDRQVGPTVQERPTRQLQRRQRRGAGAIDDEVGPLQIESVREPSRRGVGELPRDRGRLERRQAGLQVPPQEIEFLRCPFRVEDGKQADGLGDDPAVLEPDEVAAVEVVPPPDDHIDPLSGQRPGIEPGVIDGRAGCIENQELFRFTPRHGQGHDPVRGGVERDGRIEVATPTARDPIVGIRLWIVEGREGPAIGGHLARTIAVGQDVGPEREEVRRAGEPAAEADQRDVVGLPPPHRTASFCGRARSMGPSRSPRVFARSTSTSPFRPRTSSFTRAATPTSGEIIPSPREPR